MGLDSGAAYTGDFVGVAGGRIPAPAGDFGQLRRREMGPAEVAVDRLGSRSQSYGRLLARPLSALQ